MVYATVAEYIVHFDSSHRVGRMHVEVVTILMLFCG